MKDLTESQFRKALARYGIRPHFLGYYYITDTALVCAHNGGVTRREQLSYLVREQEKESR